MNPSFDEIRYFVEVAQTGNISRAAERLGITQPCLSLAVRRLEKSMGVVLLIRGKNGVKLTQPGKRFSGQARQLLNDWERLRTDSLRDDREIRGRYVIGCHPSVGMYSLPAFLPALVAEHPDLEIKLAHDLSRRIAEDVISFKVDFGIVVNPPSFPDLVIRELFEDEVTLWSAKGVRSADTLVCDPELLQTQRILRELERRKVSFRRTISSPSLEVITALARAGAGVAILPGRVARADGSNALKPWRPAGQGHAPVVADRICLIYRVDAQASKAGRAIAARISGALAP